MCNSKGNNAIWFYCFIFHLKLWFKTVIAITPFHHNFIRNQIHTAHCTCQQISLSFFICNSVSIQILFFICQSQVLCVCLWMCVCELSDASSYYLSSSQGKFWWTRWQRGKQRKLETIFWSDYLLRGQIWPGVLSVSQWPLPHVLPHTSSTLALTTPIFELGF